MIEPIHSPEEEKVLTAQEVSDLLRIPLSTLYGLTKAGKIQGVKIGKHWRYLARDVYGLWRASA